MTSPTTRTYTKRMNKVKKKGRARKNALERIGTTKTTEELFKVHKN